MTKFLYFLDEIYITKVAECFLHKLGIMDIKRGGIMKKALFGFMVIFALFIYSVGLLQFAEKKQSAEAKHSAEQVENLTRFIVKEYNGEIAVFVENETVPLRFLNINTTYLTKYDKLQFEKGILLDSIEEVLLLEEDFNS